MNKPLRAAVVGAGQIAKQHLGALAALEDVDTVGVCDLSPVMAEATADRFRLDHWFTDFRELLDRQQPDVVHITTPPGSHFELARQSIESGAHVIVEKPVTTGFEQFLELKAMAEEKNLWLIEDHNYLFNNDLQEMLTLVATGTLGALRHVDVQICLDLFGSGSRFADEDLPHPAMNEPAGIVSDFLTHLCYLAYAFVGQPSSFQAYFHRCDEQPNSPISDFQALVNTQNGTAQIGLSATSQPDSFVVKVQGTKMQVSTNLFEVGTVRTEMLGGPHPLVPIRNSRRRGKSEQRNATRSLWRKLGGGPGPYEGLWLLVERVYANLQTGGPPPVSMEQIEAVNRLVHEIQQEVVKPCAC